MKNPIELACDITALTKDEMEEVMNISGEIFAATTAIHELKDGYALSFPKTTGELIAKLTRFITLDSRCCPFIKHTLVVEPDNQGTWLHLAGEGKVKEYISNELDRELPHEIAKKIGFQRQ